MEKFLLVIAVLITDLSASGITLSKVSPVQTCHYNQHSLADTVIPLLLQEKLNQQLQSLQIQANNHPPYFQAHTSQITNQQLKNTPSEIKNELSDFYVNKILSNPVVQDILNPKPKINQPVAVENPVKTTSKPVDAPKVVNNYIIVPPDAFSKGKLRRGRTNARQSIQETQEGLKRKQPECQNRCKTECNRRQFTNKTDHEVKDTDSIVDSESLPRKKRRKNDVNNTKAAERRRKRKRLQNTDSESNLGTDNTQIDDIDTSNITEDNPRNLLDDKFIEEFCKKHPSLPKHVVEKMLSHLQRRLQKYRPEIEVDSEHPLSFDGKDEKDNKNTIKRHTNRKANNRRNMKKTVATNSETIKSSTDYPMNAEEEIELYSLEERDYNNLFAIGSRINTNGLNAQEGNQGLYSEHNNENKKIMVGKHNGNSVRNKNIGGNAFNKNRPKHTKTNGNILFRANQDSESNTRSFQSPPALETPNFQTKPILKGRKAPSRFNDKFSTYSDIKREQNDETEYYKKPERTDDRKPTIETLYGHSKVVKYGKTGEKPVETYIEMSTPTVTYYLSENMEFEDDGHSVIVTKKIPSEKVW